MLSVCDKFAGALDKFEGYRHDPEIDYKSSISDRGAMAYEYPSAAGTVRLIKVSGRWLLHFAGRHSGRWATPDVAAKAVARHRSGHAAWDRRQAEAPEDLLDWRPLGDSL